MRTAVTHTAAITPLRTAVPRASERRGPDTSSPLSRQVDEGCLPRREAVPGETERPVRDERRKLTGHGFRNQQLPGALRRQRDPEPVTLGRRVGAKADGPPDRVRRQ